MKKNVCHLTLLWQKGFETDECQIGNGWIISSEPLIQNVNNFYSSDTQSPTLSGCFKQLIPVPRYARADTVFSVPNASDNVYVQKYRVTNSVGGAIWPSENLILSRMTVFYINATDHAGNTAGCVTIAAIIGKEGELFARPFDCIVLCFRKWNCFFCFFFLG